MGRKGGSDNNVSYGGSTTSKDKIKLQSCVLSSATHSTIDAGASVTKSLSEGTITRHQRDAEASTISSDGIPLTRQCSLRRVVSLEPVLPGAKEEIINTVVGEVEKNEPVDDMQSNLKLTSKALCVDKHLLSESSSSNSSHVIAPKSQLELSAETKKGELSKGAVKQLKSCDEQASSETSQLSELLCSEKLKPSGPETWDESKKATREEQPLSKLGVTSDQGPKVCGFDLNEDFEVNEAGNADNTIDELVSCNYEASVSDPIVVVAKVGVPNGLPTVPLRFDGELGWRTSVGASAFRPTSTSKNCPKGFDLNFAPPSEPGHTVGSSMEISLKDSESVTSLNFNSEGTNRYIARPNSQILSFDLNDNLLTDKDTSSGLHHPAGLSSQPKRNYPPVDSMNGSARQGNVSGIRPAYWVDLSSMPGFTHVQGQPFLVAAPSLYPSVEHKQTLSPLQPNIAFTPGPPPSGYYMGASNGLSSSIYSPNIFPHAGSQHGTGPTLPQISGPLLATYPGSLHLMEAATQGFNPGAYTTMRPNFFLNGGMGPSENTLADERMRLSQTVALPALADKRKEPEGSWSSYQHNHRRMTTWK